MEPVLSAETQARYKALMEAILAGQVDPKKPGAAAAFLNGQSAPATVAPVAPPAPMTVEDLPDFINPVKESAAIFENTICLDIHFERWGARSHVPASLVTAGTTEKDMLSTSIKKLEAPEYEAIVKHDRETGIWIDKIGVPVAFRTGMRFIAIPKVLEVDQYLNQRAEERKSLVEVLRRAYPQRVIESEAKIDSSIPTKYPSADAVAAEYQIYWQWLEYPMTSQRTERISKALFEAESTKAQAMLRENVGVATSAMVAEAQQAFERLRDALVPDETGKRGKLYESNIKDFQRFFTDLDEFRNIGGNPALAEIAKQGRAILAEVDPKDFKGKGGTALRESLAPAVEALGAKINDLVSRSRRSIKME